MMGTKGRQRRVASRPERIRTVIPLSFSSAHSAASLAANGLENFALPDVAYHKYFATLRAFPSWYKCSVCVMLRASAGRRPVYGKRQDVTQPTSALKIPIPGAIPAQRGGAGCAEDDAPRRISEPSSNEDHPSHRSPQ